MSWTLALIASSVALAGGQYVMARQQASAGAARAKIEEQQYAKNAELAKLRADQQETDRRRELDAIMASNMAGVSYDPFTSPSFLAIENDNFDQLDRDVGNIQLMGKINAERASASAQISGIEASSFRTAGKFAWLQPGATIMQGAVNAHMIS